MNQFLQWGIDVQRGMGIDPAYHNLCATLAVSAAAIAVAVAVYYICSRVVSPMVLRIAARTSIKWDDILLNPGMMKALSEVVPAIMLSMMLPGAVALYPEAVGWVTPIMSITVVIAVTNVANRILLAVYELICSHTTIPAQSLKGIRQMLQLIAIIVAFIIVVSILVGKSPVIILSGLGASAAVLMLVFKDSILGLVAGGAAHRQRHAPSRRLDYGATLRRQRRSAGSHPHYCKGAELRHDHRHHTSVLPRQRCLPELARYAEQWRASHNALHKHRCKLRHLHDARPAFTLLRPAVGVPSRPFRPSGQPHRLPPLPGRYISTLASCVSSMTAMVRELQPTSEGIPVEIYFFTSPPGMGVI